ncbi:MAG: HAMP domain-containing sensor histidine kinase [Ferruginibacter sp.]
MKLLAKYNRINIMATISVLLISSICFYIMIRHVLINQLDEDLKLEEQEVLDFVKANNKLPYPAEYKDQQVEFIETNGKPVYKKFRSLMVFDKTESEELLSRQYQFSIHINDKMYTVLIRKSQEETEDLIKMIAWVTLGIVILLLLILFLINRFLLSRLWKPFDNTLAQLKQFNLSSKNNITPKHTDINEFTELNKSVLQMTERVKQDYESLKNFTDNASHEMQTPLAIINSKLDVLIQDETLSEFQMLQLQGVYNAMDRLSNLNQSLLLLTKIENSQFKEQENISLDALLKERLSEFEELFDAKKLVVNLDLAPVHISANKQLLDILISNLLNNSIRYNIRDGDIFIHLKENRLSISNSSFLPALDKQKIFQRFYRHADTKQDGNGLGLSIVKQICTIAGYDVKYSFQNNRHCFEIDFIKS